MAGPGKCEGEINERERKLKGQDWQITASDNKINER